MEKINELIDDKENKINDLNEEINKRKKEIEELNDSVNDLGQLNNNQAVSNELPLKLTDFDDENMLYGYKIIKKSFDFDYENIIRDFLKNNVKNDDKFAMYLKIKEQFSYDLIYKLLSLEPSNQLTIIHNMLDDKERIIIDELIDKKKFNLKQMLSNLNGMIIKNDPKIKIYVGDKNINYNFLDKNIETIYDNKITEGFKIYYKGIIYDYSI